MSVNLWIGVGNLGRDPEIKTLQSGSKVANFSIACNEVYKDKAGKRQERVEWVNIVAWEKLAEAAEYLKKGREVYIEGSLRTETVEKDGVTKYYTKVVARKIEFIGPKPADGEGNEEAF
jgi:single-strand DNA-binding protein